FFQAEDGIRDDLVTGVQTCALPIWNKTALCDCWRRFPTSRRSSRAPPAAGARGKARRAPQGARRLTFAGWRARCLGRAALQRSACARSAGPRCLAAVPAVLALLG